MPKDSFYNGGKKIQSNWRSTKLWFQMGGSIFCAVCFAVGVFLLPVFGQERISDTVACALIGAIFAGAGVYGIGKVLQNRKAIEVDGNHDPAGA